jgi:hypothetical protein
MPRERAGPEMARGEAPEESHAVNQHLWQTLPSVQIETPMEGSAHDCALETMREIP